MQNSEEKPAVPFQFRRVVSLLVLLLIFILECFQRTGTQTLDFQRYGVSGSMISVFTSVYFWPRACMQIVAGCFADEFDSGSIVGITQIFASIGMFICAASPLSKDSTVGFSSLFIVGRFLVGFGCGPTYMCVTRFLINWFDRKHYSFWIGIAFSVGHLGSVVSLTPFSLMLRNHPENWPAAFLILGGINFLLSIVCICFVYGDPVSCGYEAVNEDMKPRERMSLRVRFHQLFINLSEVVKIGNFWKLSCWSMCLMGPYFAISTSFGGKYVARVFGDDDKWINMAIVIGVVVGSICVPFLIRFLIDRSIISTHSRKVIVACSSVLAAVLCAHPLAFLFGNKDNTAYKICMFIIFFLIGVLTIQMSNVIFPLLSEYYSPGIAGTAVGTCNFLAFVFSGILILAGLGINESNTTPYLFTSWIVCAVLCVVGGVVVLSVQKNEEGSVVVFVAEENNNKKKEIGSEGEIETTTCAPVTYDYVVEIEY